MNSVIADITLRAMLGRARSLVLVLLPLTLVALAVALRLAPVSDAAVTAPLLATYALEVVVPLVALIVGTGVLGAEIDDGTVIHLLTKPIPRPVVAATKLAVAVGLAATFGAVPALLAGTILAGFTGGFAVGVAVAALAASAGYCAIFLALSVALRHALAVGLVYVLVWESLIANVVEGAKVLSVQGWARSLGDAIAAAPQVQSSVGVPTAVVLLVVVVLAGSVLTDQRLRSFRIKAAD